MAQATLGIGTGTKKSVVQCNVGKRSPVFLCSLFPQQSESCQLNLEFEEADEVVFSVIGPISVHLTGYYVGGSRHYKQDESYPCVYCTHAHTFFRLQKKLNHKPKQHNYEVEQLYKCHG